MARRRPSAAARAKLAAESLAAFVAASPSSFHAAAEAARRLEEAGFEALDEREAWPEGPGARFVVRDGAIIAWRVLEGVDAAAPFAIVGAHTDSPGFRLKPEPDHEAFGWRQLAAEVYGGPLANSWLDRELRIAGRVVLADGTTRLVATDPVARIPQLAIHLDRQVNSDGLKLDPQKHLRPVLGPGSGPDAKAIVAKAAGVEPGELASWDLFLADAQEPRVYGEPALLASGRLDNLASVYAAIAALIETVPSGVIPVVACFDHEEVGSASRSGAGGPFLEDVLARIRAGLGAGEEDRRRGLAASWCVSSDVGHSVHPNYAERHDDDTRPVAGQGPIVKINANQRYASDASGAAMWAGVCVNAGVPVQSFVSSNAIPCGSTIGPITATRLGIRTVDVGIPILSMHSARELCAAGDVDGLERALAVFLAGGWPERA
ncbi:putative M18 family aminopeptidase 2 [Pseudoclavibacter triregionum]|nr:putative M18 family aminopeptidase 2 [Pseudoclavibacter triregionum]